MASKAHREIAIWIEYQFWAINLLQGILQRTTDHPGSRQRIPLNTSLANFAASDLGLL